MTEQEFDALQEHEKRITIAKDIIGQVLCDRWTPSAGKYVEVTDDIELQLPVKENIDLKCDVCALGAAFLAIARYKNTIIFNDVTGIPEDIGGTSADSLIKNIFTVEQLALIEASFEHDANNAYTNMNDGYILSDDEVDICKAFYNSFTSSHKRMIAIMENIIANEGTFKPELL